MCLMLHEPDLLYRNQDLSNSVWIVMDRRNLITNMKARVKPTKCSRTVACLLSQMTTTGNLQIPNAKHCS